MTDLLDRLRTGLADRYDVDRRIGEGGMATVFRAVDRKHGRAVAIKVFRPELAATMGTERFIREIELAAKLQHPHIVPLYDSGATDGIVYYVMPFVEGESLRDRLEREKSLRYDDAVSLVRDVASALSYAHERGIVHRDIKPENILLSGGHAMVADFGIARAVSAAQEGQRLTGLGFAVGTPMYMSPEQATATEVDARSDQYSLACVLYEAVSGQPPFVGSTVQSVLKQSLSGVRPRLSKVANAVPGGADPVIAKALASDPAERYPSVLEFVRALTETATPAPKTQRQIRVLFFLVGLFAAAWATGLVNRLLKARGRPVSEGSVLAVLPFATSGAEVAALGEGMVDLLSTNLNAVGGTIKAVEPRLVMARWRANGGAGDAAARGRLARDLEATGTVTGSLVAAGGRTRLNAMVYDLAGNEVARAQVEGPQDSILAFVDQLSGELIRRVWTSKEPIPSLRVSAMTTLSFEAMGAYLEGERYYRRAQWDSAEVAFTRAIERDSTFSLAHYRLSATIGWKGGYGSPRARAASAAALRFSSRLPPRERAIVMGYDLFNRGRPDAADSMARYVGSYPRDVDGWFLLGESQYHAQVVNMLGPDSLRVPFDRVLQLDSTLSPAAIHPAELALWARDSSGLEHYIRVLADNGSHAQADAFRAAGSMVFGGRLDEATLLSAMGWPGSVRAALVGVLRDPAIRSDSLIGYLGRVLTLPGRRDQAASADMTFARAIFYAGLGRYEQADRVVDTLASIDPFRGTDAALVPVVLGLVPSERAGPLLDRMLAVKRTDPMMVRRQVGIALARGNEGLARHLVDSMLAVDSTRLGDMAVGLFEADRGRALLARGDTTQAIVWLRRGIRRAGASGSYFASTDRLDLAQALAARPETRGEGIRMLEWGFVNDFQMVAWSELLRGRVAESAGDKGAAVRHYSRFLRLWDQPATGAEGPATEARNALRRLTGEGQPLR